MTQPTFYFHNPHIDRTHPVAPHNDLEDVARLAERFTDVFYFANGEVPGFEPDLDLGVAADRVAVGRCGECGAWLGPDHRCPSRRHEGYYVPTGYFDLMREFL